MHDIKTGSFERPQSSRSFYTFSCICIYFSFVAMPPRICRSCLLISSTQRTFFASAGLIRHKRSVQSLCTVLLLIPNRFAACRTVALFSIINPATSTALSSIYSFKRIPCLHLFTMYAGADTAMLISFNCIVLCAYTLLSFRTFLSHHPADIIINIYYLHRKLYIFFNLS